MEVKLWKDSAKKELDSELFSETAEKLAKEFWTDYANSSMGKKKNNPSQIRKFYDEVQFFDAQLVQGGEGKAEANFARFLPYIKMLNAKAAYAVGRDLISLSFRDFIKGALVQIKNRDDFRVFVRLFEAVMGYFKYYVEKEKPQRDFGGHGGGHGGGGRGGPGGAGGGARGGSHGGGGRPGQGRF